MEEGVAETETGSVDFWLTVTVTFAQEADSHPEEICRVLA
jgi:hypothetical protein